MDRHIRLLASIGLAVGAVFGMAGVFAPSAALRGLAWGIDGTALVMAGALLTVGFYRSGLDLVASGFLVFTVGEGLILSTAAMDLSDGVPLFGAGAALWATGLVLIGVPTVFPFGVRISGFVAAALFGITAAQIFAGGVVTPTTTPLPFFAYPALVGTMGGWIWALVRPGTTLRAAT